MAPVAHQANTVRRRELTEQDRNHVKDVKSKATTFKHKTKKVNSSNRLGRRRSSYSTRYRAVRRHSADQKGTKHDKGAKKAPSNIRQKSGEKRYIKEVHGPLGVRRTLHRHKNKGIAERNSVRRYSSNRRLDPYLIYRRKAPPDRAKLIYQIIRRRRHHSTKGKKRLSGTMASFPSADKKTVPVVIDSTIHLQIGEEKDVVAHLKAAGSLAYSKDRRAMHDGPKMGGQHIHRQDREDRRARRRYEQWRQEDYLEKFYKGRKKDTRSWEDRHQDARQEELWRHEMARHNQRPEREDRYEDHERQTRRKDDKTGKKVRFQLPDGPVRDEGPRRRRMDVDAGARDMQEYDSRTRKGGLQDDRWREQSWRHDDDEKMLRRQFMDDGEKLLKRKDAMARPRHRPEREDVAMDRMSRRYEGHETRERKKDGRSEKKVKFQLPDGPTRDNGLKRRREDADARARDLQEGEFARVEPPKGILSESRVWPAEEKKRLPEEQVMEVWDLPQEDAERLQLQQVEDERLKRLLAEEDLARSRTKDDLEPMGSDGGQLSKMRHGQFVLEDDSSTSVTFYDAEKPVDKDRIGFHVQKKIKDYNDMVKKLAAEAALGDQRPLVHHDGSKKEAMGRPQSFQKGRGLEPFMEKLGTAAAEDQDMTEKGRLRRLQQQMDDQRRQLHATEDEMRHLKDLEDAKQRHHQEDEIERLRHLQEEVNERLMRVAAAAKHPSPSRHGSPVTYYDSEDLADEDQIGYNVLKKRGDYEDMLKRKFGGRPHGWDDAKSGGTIRPSTLAGAEGYLETDETLGGRPRALTGTRYHGPTDREAPEDLQAGRPTGPPVTYYDSEDLASEDEIGHRALKKRDDYERMLNRKFGGNGQRRLSGGHDADAIHLRRHKDDEDSDGAKDSPDEEDAYVASDEVTYSSPEATPRRRRASPTATPVTYYDSEDLASPDDIGHHVTKKRDDYEKMLKRKTMDDELRKGDEDSDGAEEDEVTDASAEATPRTWHGSPTATPMTYYDSEDLASQDEIGHHALKKRDDYEKMLKRKFMDDGPRKDSGGHDTEAVHIRRHAEEDYDGADEDEMTDNFPEATPRRRHGSPTATPVTYYDSEDLASEDEIGHHALNKRDDYEKMLERKFMDPGGQDMEAVHLRRHADEDSYVAEDTSIEATPRMSRGSPTATPVTYYDSEDLASEDEIGHHVLDKRDDYGRMLERKFGGGPRRKTGGWTSDHAGGSGTSEDDAALNRKDMLRRKYVDRWRQGRKQESSKWKALMQALDDYRSIVHENVLPPSVPEDTPPVPYFDSDDLASEDDIGHHVPEKKEGFLRMLKRKFAS